MSLALLLIALHLASVAQSLQMDPQTIQALVERSVKVHRAWGAQMSSAGASADAPEIYRRPGSGQTIVADHVFIRGRPDTKNRTLHTNERLRGKCLL
jgi:hypothetical protein